MERLEKEIKNGIENIRSRNFWRVSVFDRLDSTNDYVKSLLSEKSEGEVVVARTQNKGRGRQNRTFYSLDGGLYFSILLHPTDFPIDKITPMSAVAVRRAVKSVFGRDLAIKWVNDLYLNDKKVVGILAESSFLCENVAYVVLGIGINVYEPKEGFAPEISDIAGALEKKFGERRGELLARVLDEIYDCYIGGKDYLDEYIHESYLVGKNVLVKVADESVEGLVKEIDKDCKLVLQTENGERRFLSGEVVKVVV